MKYLSTVILLFTVNQLESHSLSLGSGPGFITGNCILLPESAIASSVPLVSQSSLFILWNLAPFLSGNVKTALYKSFAVDASITGLWLTKGQGIIQAFSKAPSMETSIRSISYFSDVKNSLAGYTAGLSFNLPYMRDIITLRSGFTGRKVRTQLNFLYDPTIFFSRETTSGVYIGFDATLNFKRTTIIASYDWEKTWVTMRIFSNNDLSVTVRKILLFNNAFSLNFEYQINENCSISESIVYKRCLNNKLGTSTTFTPNQEPTTLCNVRRLEEKTILLQTKLVYKF